MKVGTVWAVVVVVAVGVCCVPHAQGNERAMWETGYGIFEYYNAEGNWVVIDDQAMLVDDDIEIRDDVDSGTDDVADVEPGTPVRFTYRIDKQVWHVSAIRLIDEIPYIVDEEGVSER